MEVKESESGNTDRKYIIGNYSTPEVLCGDYKCFPHLVIILVYTRIHI